MGKQGTRVSNDTKLRVLEMFEDGKSNLTIASALGISTSTIWHIKQEFYDIKEDDMDSVIAGNKHDGLLTATGNDVYVGTCLTRNGKMKKRIFRCSGSQTAITMWEKWKETLGVKVERTHEMATQLKSEPDVTKASESVMELTTPIYALVVGSPSIAGYFTDFEKALQTEKIVNQALKAAGIDLIYNVVEIKKYSLAI